MLSRAARTRPATQLRRPRQPPPPRREPSVTHAALFGREANERHGVCGTSDDDHDGLATSLRGRVRAWKGHAQPSPVAAGAGQVPAGVGAPAETVLIRTDPSMRPGRARPLPHDNKPPFARIRRCQRSVDNSSRSRSEPPPAVGNAPVPDASSVDGRPKDTVDVSCSAAGQGCTNSLINVRRDQIRAGSQSVLCSHPPQLSTDRCMRLVGGPRGVIS